MFARSLQMFASAVLAAVALGFVLGGPARADSALACGHALSPPISTKWIELGGEHGALGCPVADEAAAAPSKHGSTAREADFAGGMVVWHATGPRAGQTFVVTGCAFRLYFQYGGTGSWLGLPLGDLINTPDGRRQAFEGGTINYTRAIDDCDAEPTAAVLAPVAAAQTSPLELFFDRARGDYLTGASAATAKTAAEAGYKRMETEAFAMTEETIGAVPLKLYWNEAAGDHMTVATAEGERAAQGAGYEFEASQGFVWPDPRPGARPLKQYRNPMSGHHMLAATPEGEAEAAKAGFVFERIEGYAPGTP